MEKTAPTTQPLSIRREKVIAYMQNKRNLLYQQGYTSSRFIRRNTDCAIDYPENEVYTEDDIHDINRQFMESMPRDQLKGVHEPIPDHLARWEKDQFLQEIVQKINDRTMTEEEYTKIMDQIKTYWSVLPESNKRIREYSWWRWDIILSLTTGKIYDVESTDGLKTLLEDYHGKQYYQSRSWASREGYIYAGKASLVYLPMMRMDVRYPEREGGTQNINGLQMAVLTSRGTIDPNYPTVIKNCAWADVVLLDQSDHLSPEGAGKMLGDAIKTQWASLERLPLHTFTTEYYDENLEPKTLSFTYRTNMDPKDIRFNDIGKYFLDINRGFDLESTGRFIDKVTGIRKHKDKYVRIGTFGLIKEVFDTNPIRDQEEKMYIEDFEIWSSNIIHRTKTEVPLSTTHEPLMINGREIVHDLAVKKNKKTVHMDKYQIESICREHNIDPETISGYTENPYEAIPQKTYFLVYEKKLSDLHADFNDLPTMYMEYEANIPYEVYHAFPRTYREQYMKGKLAEKAFNEIYNMNRRDTDKQKEIIKKYLCDNLSQRLVAQDSYTVGNCIPGTEDFMKAYRIPAEGITAHGLLKHPRFEQMLEISSFRAVILKKVRNELLEAIEENAQ